MSAAPCGIRSRLRQSCLTGLTMFPFLALEKEGFLDALFLLGVAAVRQSGEVSIRGLFRPLGKLSVSICLFSIVLFAFLAIRWNIISNQVLSYDESFTWWMTQYSVATIFDRLFCACITI